MPKTLANEMYERLIKNLTDRRFLRKMSVSKKYMQELFNKTDMREMAAKLSKTKKPSCAFILETIQPLLAKVCEEVPEHGWLQYCCDTTLYSLFPEEQDQMQHQEFEKGRFFLFEVLHTVFEFEREHRKFSPVEDFDFLTKKEAEKYYIGSEYRKMLKLVRSEYICEFMKISAEITPFNTLGHIAGVHYVSMHVARQLAQLDVPVDLALVSAAAFCHDIGKFGCRGNEAARVPYLHYYYTDDYLRRNGMPMTAHIASNHSTWDLELENLSVESLILIYADFRVKSNRMANGEEEVRFYTLQQAFDVILNKLDNVDEKKEARYKRVYRKLYDFEEYMKSLGVSVSLKSSVLKDTKWTDAALLDSAEVVTRLKYLAIKHNIEVMNKLSNEKDFGNLLENARSEKQWENIRAYINTLKEYCTYMTHSQKKMTIEFLKEQLVNREGDIRRQSGGLIGEMIACYDEDYRKELPEGAKYVKGREDSHYIWKKHIDGVIFPDLKTTEQQRRWIGYSLKVTLRTLLSKSSENDRYLYLEDFIKKVRNVKSGDTTIFILLVALLEIPVEMCRKKDINHIISFCQRAMESNSVEVQIAGLRVIRHIAESSQNLPAETANRLELVMRKKTVAEESVTVQYLRTKIEEKLNHDKISDEVTAERLFEAGTAASDIFRDNLKVGTPWTIKAVNIELLLDSLNCCRREEVFYIATHLANLLKVSERVTVRHSAGRGLVTVFELLSNDQRNEIVIELTKGLEIGDYQFSKYIPEYLGVLILTLQPEELDETVLELQHFLESSNDRVASVSLDTIGVLLASYDNYRGCFGETEEAYYRRKEKLLGLVLRGMANYHEPVSQEAFMVLGQNIFGSPKLSLEQKQDIFCRIYKKMLTLIEEKREVPLRFFNNAASLNHIYRFISDYEFFVGNLKLKTRGKAAFFPGTFDPFSLGHKGIVTTIRDMGYEVYLALDEFSWSKKTQARMYRKAIMNMSCADETGVYIFPDDEPVNIANDRDIEKLKSILHNKELYIVVGSDVVANASSYKKETTEHSIHTLNHIIFKRESMEQGTDADCNYSVGMEKILGNVVELTLPIHLEDISSTRIRENIDQNRDISSLIDPVVQNYIYDNALYLREPQYKQIVSSKELKFKYAKNNGRLESVSVLNGSDVLLAKASVHPIKTRNLYDEFRNQDLAGFIREKAVGSILVIRDIHVSNAKDDMDPYHLILTETLAEALKEDFTYAVYFPNKPNQDRAHLEDVLKRQGFVEIMIGGEHSGCFGVDMRNPVTIIQNMGSVLKNPFNKNERVEAALGAAHIKLQKSLTELYPGSLILSINSSVMHHKLIRIITKENMVPPEPTKVRQLGPYMCVPFGKILNGMAVPNTVTKTLHMEKSFSSDLSGFEIKEYPFYSSIDNQLKTIKSFDRQVILVDDLLHKGYRMKRIDPLLKENDVEVEKIVVGILSGRGKDLMTVQGRDVESVYFVPNLKAWFVESSQYPFIGGDGIESHTATVDDSFTAINLIMPYVMPSFVKNVDKKAFYRFSRVCLENARDILRVVEEEYQKEFQRKLTLQRLSEAVIAPKLTDVGQCLKYDKTIAASEYIESDLEKLLRLKEIIL